MKKAGILVAFIAIAIGAVAVARSSTNASDVLPTAPTDSLCSGSYSKQKALADIKAGKARLAVQGGIAAVYFASDKVFLDKYKVGYDILGCVMPDSVDCLATYNQTIFDHLNTNFGKGWQREVRKDVIGL